MRLTGDLAVAFVPEEHRLPICGIQQSGRARRAYRRYGDLCWHYGMRASRNNPGHENGSIERSHQTPDRLAPWYLPPPRKGRSDADGVQNLRSLRHRFRRFHFDERMGGDDRSKFRKDLGVVLRQELLNFHVANEL